MSSVGFRHTNAVSAVDIFDIESSQWLEWPTRKIGGNPLFAWLASLLLGLQAPCLGTYIGTHVVLAL